MDKKPLDELLERSLPRNAKLHDARIALSIAEFGFIQPVVINDETGHILGGHGRVASLAGMRAEGQPPPAGLEDWQIPVYTVTVPAHLEEAAALALNGLTEAGGYDEGVLIEIIETVKSAAGDVVLNATGFDPARVSQIKDIVEAIKTAGETRPPSRRAKGMTATRAQTVRVVLAFEQLSILELAIKATGLPNRGDALLKICRAYLGGGDASGER